MDEELQGLVTKMIEAGVPEDKIRAFISEYAKPKELGIADYAGHFAGKFNKGAIGVVSGGFRGAEEMASAVRNLPLMRDIPESPADYLIGHKNPKEGLAYQTGEAIDQLADIPGFSATQTNPEIEKMKGIPGWLLNDLPQAAGSTLGFAGSLGVKAAEAIPVALEGRVATPTQLLGKATTETGKAMASKTGVLGGAVGVNETFQEAKKAGLSDEDALKAGIQNYIGGATEAIPLEHIFMRLNKMTGGGLVNWVKKNLPSGFEEGIQQSLQKYWENKVAQGNYDPERDPMIDVLKEGGTAFVVGFLLPGISTMGTIAQKDRTRIIAALQKKTQAANQEYANKTGETYKKFNPEFGPVAPKGGLGLPPVIAKTDPLVPSTGNLGLDKQIDNAVLNPDATASAVLNPEGQIQFQENLPNEQDHAIQEQSTGGVLTHPQTEGSEPGGVGSSIQGQETAPARQEEGQVNGPTTGSLVSPGEQVQNPEVQALQAERDSKIQEVSRPETKLALLSDKKVLDTKVDVTGPGGETTTMPARRLHRKIEVESNQLEELLDCLHGIRK